MSVTISANVWKHSKARGTPFLVLLCLADFANDQGESFPAIATIAKKCRLKDERHVQRVMRKLEEINEVVVICGAGKSSSKGGVRSNRYRVIVQAPSDSVTPAEGPGSRGFHPGPLATPTPVGEPPPDPG
jgi:hypothetical protein